MLEFVCENCLYVAVNHKCLADVHGLWNPINAPNTFNNVEHLLQNMFPEAKTCHYKNRIQSANAKQKTLPRFMPIPTNSLP